MAQVIAISDGMRGASGSAGPDLPPPSHSAHKGKFAGNRHTLAYAIRLVTGPNGYTEESAAKKTGHSLRAIRAEVRRRARLWTIRQQLLGDGLRRAA